MAICPTTNFTALAFVSFHSSVCEYIINSSPSNKYYIYIIISRVMRVCFTRDIFFLFHSRKRTNRLCFTTRPQISIYNNEQKQKKKLN